MSLTRLSPIEIEPWLTSMMSVLLTTFSCSAAEAVTIAVLACGVDYPYPAGHADLFAAIAGQGLVISEWPPGRRPARTRFLVRNRVIAALARATIVVEAAERSGSLITAELALDLGRDVGAVPGPVLSWRSRPRRIASASCLVTVCIQRISSRASPGGALSSRISSARWKAYSAY